MDHPGVDFWDEPSGRRARVVGTGLAVWEVVMVLRANDDSIAETAEYLSLPRAFVESAVGYYLEYRAEIDACLEMNDRAFDEAVRRYPSALA